MYDDRLYIKQRFQVDDKSNGRGKERVNNLKMIKMVEYVQVYVDSAGKWAGIRLDRNAVEKIIKYLQNSLDSIK